eukprot:712136-Karenia_brevis.AAC.1
MHSASCAFATEPSGPLHIYACHLLRYWPAGLAKPKQHRWWPAGSSPIQHGRKVGVTCLHTSAGPVVT